MVEVRVESLSLGDINAVRGLVVVAGQNVVDVGSSSGSHSQLGLVNWPRTLIRVFGLCSGE